MRPISLPRLPVPDLRQTLDKYLTSLQPLLLEDERRGGVSYRSAYALRRNWADEFEAGIGKTCQERLIALDHASPNNWLDDNFWMNKAYLEWRAPLVVNSNWWLAFHDDDQIPHGAKVGESSSSRAGITKWQIRRAAWLVHRILDFKDRLHSQELHPETTRTGVWLRDSTSKMFNIARVPKPHCDVISNAPDPTTPSALKFTLTIHNWFYSVTAYDPPPQSPGASYPKLKPVHEIESQLREVVLDVEQRLASGDRAVPIGILSADDRDRWSENLSHLLSLSPTNRCTHQSLLTSLLGLSLDHITHTTPPSSSLKPSTTTSTTPQHILDAHLHTIRSTPLNASNRFFDKPFTFVVDPSTRAGAMGEHSPCDALVPSIAAEYAVVVGIDEAAFAPIDVEEDTGGQGSDVPKQWDRLDWVVDAKIEKACQEAGKRVTQILKDSDDSVMWFEEYGTDWIKDVAKLAPDAYIQMVLQLAWYRTRGEFTATYETVLTRMFKHGRTETLRTLTTDSRNFVLAMQDPKASMSDRRQTLHKAIQSHSLLTRAAATGKGIDRHLLGLRLMLRPLHGESAELFEDELFERSSTWKLSTSGLSAGHLFRGTGFGTAYKDGYGINYLAAPSMIKFGIESKHSSPLTSTNIFKNAVASALQDMKEVCLVGEMGLGDGVSNHILPSHL